VSVVRRTFTREFKLDLCRRIDQGLISKTSACREYGLSNGLLDRWVEQFKVKGEGAFEAGSPVDPQQRIKELEASLGRAHLENEFLKEALGKLGVQVRRQP